LVVINISYNNKRQREEAERQARLRRQREEVERQARLRQQREEAERQARLRQQREEAERQAWFKREREEAEKKRKEAEIKKFEELNNETLIVVYESVDENNKPKAIVKRSDNTYASVTRPFKRFRISEKIRLAKEIIDKWNWYDEIIYQREQVLEKQKIQNQHLDNFGINYLYHMTHRGNLENILQVGLKSHNYARQNELMQKDIANNDVNNRRSKVEPIYNKSLHDYVPLYFNPKNPMLFVRKSIQKDIVILAIDRSLIYAENSIFTDRNAANAPTKFFNNTNSLNQINWECVRAEYWNGFEDGKREKMAEILVFPDISAKNIQKIYCNNSDTLQFIQEKTRNHQHIEIELTRNLYFED
jgi:hypothetical protein